MKFIKMHEFDIEGGRLDGTDGGNYRARYVRADVLDEIVIVETTIGEEDGTETPIYSVEGFVYDVSPDERLYEIAYFDTLAEAQKFLADLIADINAEGKT